MKRRRSSIGALGIIGAAAGLACTTEIDAVRICSDESNFDLSGTIVLPFGGEILGASTLEGTIVNTRVDITFTATEMFDAANLGLSIGLPVNGSGAGLGFTGADLGWSGQGTFTASFESPNLNGDLSLGGQAWYTWFVTVSNLDLASGPITGSFDELVYTFEFADCPVGDLNGDIAVGFDDLVALLAEWGDPGCSGATPCAADLDGDGAVGLTDLTLLLSNWGDQFCPAPPSSIS